MNDLNHQYGEAVGLANNQAHSQALSPIAQQPHQNFERAAQHARSNNHEGSLSHFQEPRSPVSNVDLHHRTLEIEGNRSVKGDPVVIPHGSIQYNRNSCIEQQKPHMMLINENKTAQHSSEFLLQQNNESQKMPVRIGASKRINSTDRQKRYKISQNPSVIINQQKVHRIINPDQHQMQTSKTFSGDGNNILASPQANYIVNHYNSPKPVQNQRLLPDRVVEQQRHASQIRQEPASKTSQQLINSHQKMAQQPTTTIMGLGLGMGIQMGNDGKYYASMGGMRMQGGSQQAPENDIYATPSISQQNSPIAGTMLSPKQVREGQIIRQKVTEVNVGYQTQGSAGKEPIISSDAPGLKQNKKLLQPVIQSGTRSLIQQPSQQLQISPSNGNLHSKRRDSRLIRGNLDEYQEIFKTVQDQAKQKMLQKSNPAAPQPESEDLRPSLYQKMPNKNSSKKQSRSNYHDKKISSQQSLHEKGLVGIRQRTRDATDASQAQKSLNEQGYHHSHHVPLYVSNTASVNNATANLGGHPSELKLSNYHGETYQSGQKKGNAQQLTNLPINKSQQMNSTNESSFTEKPNYSHQLMSHKNLDVAASSFSMGQPANSNVVTAPITSSHRNGTNSSQIVQLGPGEHLQQQNSMRVGKNLSQSVDPRPHILMKNRVEEGSKQLKHEVAQQIIGTNNHSTGIASAKARMHGSQTRRTSLVPNGQVQLPHIKLQTESKTEIASPHNGAINVQLGSLDSQNNQQALNVFYKQITSDNISLGRVQGDQIHMSQLSQNQKMSPQMQKHNSMEHLLVAKAASRNNLSIIGNENIHMPQVGASQAQANFKSVPVTDDSLQNGLSYRMVSDKRASQPPIIGEEHQEVIRREQRKLLQDHVEHVRRNSVQASPQAQPLQANMPQQIMIPPSTRGSYHENVQKSTQRSEMNEDGVNHQNQPYLTPENAEWIRKAIEASQQTPQKKLLQQRDSGYLNQLQADSANRSQNQNQKQYMQMGTPIFQAPQPFPGRGSPKAGDNLSPQHNRVESANKARLLVEKKKRLFEHQTDPVWQLQMIQQQQQAMVEQQVAQEQLQQQLLAHQSRQGILVGNAMLGPELSKQTQDGMMCVPNLAYRSNPPPQGTMNQVQSSKIRNLGEHPLNSQQLLNGYSKNLAAASAHPKSVRKQQQDRVLAQQQGIQGKNITIMAQNKAFAHQANLMNHLKKVNASLMGADGTIQGNDAALLNALEAQLDPEDFKALQLIQQQLQKGGIQLSNSQSRKNLLSAMHAAETGQIQSSIAQNQRFQTNSAYNQGKESQSSFFQFGVPRQSQGGRLSLFNHNGQTYVRNNESNKVYPSNLGRSLSQSELIEQEQQLNHLDQLQAQQLQQQQQSQQSAQPINHQSMSNAAYMADQMVSLSIGSRSLSKMLEGAQLEAVFQQLAKNQGYLTNENIDQYQKAQMMQMAEQLKHSPRSPMKVHGRQENIRPKVFQNSPLKQGMRAGESNGSLSTKAATSTTLNSKQGKGDLAEESKKGKKGKKPVKQRVHIFHDWDEQQEKLKKHQINKAINTINNIIRLIFKNNKDSAAITSTNQSNSLSGPPPNRLMEEYRIVELQKIAKQIQIQIPRKFDSKASLREFFYSREFILNVKIKMQNLLHKAILSSNNLPQSVIEANSYGNMALATGQPLKEGESKIYQAKRFWVGQGNNFPIVKSVLKQRFWWRDGSEENFSSEVDFIWTSWKKQKHIDYLTKVNNTMLAKAKQKQRQEGQVADTVITSSIAETEQKASSQEAKPTKKKKGAETETVATQAQVDKIVFPMRLYNRVEQNKQLTNKKGLFLNMRNYYEALGTDPFKVLPLTFHTTQGVNDPEFHKFSNCYNALEQKLQTSERKIKEAIKQYHQDKKEAATNKAKKTADEEDGVEPDTDDEEAIEKIEKKFRTAQNTWIIKPGENTNRGVGITVVKTLREVQQIVGRPSKRDGDRTFIIQKYIDYPLLVHKRKFDFRCFGLLTSINGGLKGYCYQDGYIRTSCREYTLDDVTDQLIHLTNDAIQQKADDYGKFENGNKLSWQDFTKVICAQQPEIDFDFHRDIFPQIQKLIADTFKAAFSKIDPQRLQNSFELFGYDFMIDENFRLYLIEVNTNPCLEVCCPLLARIIPEVLDNSFKIVLDPLFPSPDLSHNRKFQLNELPQEVKFQLVFDEEVEGEEIRQNFLKGVKGSIREEDIESDKENELAEDDGDADAY